MSDESVAGGEQPFQLIGSGGEHGLAREVICSLPRSVSCRLCRGEKDCPYIVERPFARLIVRKRQPTTLVVRDLVDVSTGAANSPDYRTPLWQWAIAALGWVMVPFAIVWFYVIEPSGWTNTTIPALVMLATFVITITGVPAVRWRWRDHGGRRAGGPWRPS